MLSRLLTGKLEKKAFSPQLGEVRLDFSHEKHVPPQLGEVRLGFSPQKPLSPQLQSATVEAICGEI